MMPLSDGSVSFRRVVSNSAIATKKRVVPVVSAKLELKDIIGAWKVRWGIGRSKYRVDPGLYALGAPSTESPVMVTANYKLSFDALRKELGGIDTWILVLDTKGVNVWCAAGKGTFGTEELISRLGMTELKKYVTHRTLILPQLGAVGLAAHEVAKASGFRVVYGPVRASDIPAFLAAGMKKDPSMRRVRFGLYDRMAIAPLELSQAWPYVAVALGLSVLLPLLERNLDMGNFGRHLLVFASPLVVGTLVFPALLPYLPFRAFVAKGAVLGFAWTTVLGLVLGMGLLEAIAFFLVAGSVIAFIAMNYTGSSTYTGLAGAKLEVKFGLPILIVAVVVGAALAVFRFVPLFLRGILS